MSNIDKLISLVSLMKEMKEKLGDQDTEKTVPNKEKLEGLLKLDTDKLSDTKFIDHLEEIFKACPTHTSYLRQIYEESPLSAASHWHITCNEKNLLMLLKMLTLKMEN